MLFSPLKLSMVSTALGKTLKIFEVTDIKLDSAAQPFTTLLSHHILGTLTFLQFFKSTTLSCFGGSSYLLSLFQEDFPTLPVAKSCSSSLLQFRSFSDLEFSAHSAQSFH